MFNHQPPDYVCPFCDFLAGHETEYKQQTDIVYQDKTITAFVAPKWWKQNPGHVLVIPNAHYENLYDIPEADLATAYAVVKKLAVAIRSTYGCDGTSTRQHNEPAGNQAIWHFHIHVFPRYNNDDLYQNHDDKSFVDAKTRASYAEKIKAYLAKHKTAPLTFKACFWLLW